MSRSIMFILLWLCLISITLSQNCKQGERYVSTGIGNKPNGCGGNEWQVHLGEAVLPYDGLMEPCCNQHDICYG